MDSKGYGIWKGCKKFHSDCFVSVVLVEALPPVIVVVDVLVSVVEEYTTEAIKRCSIPIQMLRWMFQSSCRKTPVLTRPFTFRIEDVLS